MNERNFQIVFCALITGWWLVPQYAFAQKDFPLDFSDEKRAWLADGSERIAGWGYW